MHTNARLPEPGEFVGRWRVDGPRICDIALSDRRVESANAYALEGARDCLEGLLGTAVAGWRPAPDGIEFTRPDRLRAAFFAFDEAGATATLPGGRATLRRHSAAGDRR